MGIRFYLKWIIFSFLILFILVILSSRSQVVRASDGEGKSVRKSSVLVSYTRSQWWLIRWADNLILCTVYTAETGIPTGDDIFDSCGREIFNTWASTPPCDQEAVNCDGVYLHLVGREPAEKTITVDLPPMEVHLTIGKCENINTANLCNQVPTLIFTGYEPIPNQEIIAVRGYIDGLPFHCAMESCEIFLRPTPMRGAQVEFWAESSFGDSSEHFTALVRVVESGFSADPTLRGYYVDVISSQWKGRPAPTCAQIWNSLPPIGEPVDWLSTPVSAEFLATDNPYYYLAGRLIAQGIINADSCTGGGLQANGYANECGLDLARPAVVEWQNRYDQIILDVANEVVLPAQILKNIFAQESQFWPGAFKDPREFGLGQLTDSGAETILLWDTRFFFKFCPEVLDAEACSRGYVFLDDENQKMVRGALANQVNPDCPTCPAGVDLMNVEKSIDLFAHTLVANCAQVSRIVFNATSQSPGLMSDYESLWRMTAANYHIGPGCVSYAVFNTYARREALTWENVSKYLTPACLGAASYVEKVTE
jgi:hypothetical protein